jgi:hypothetical protein
VTSITVEDQQPANASDTSIGRRRRILRLRQARTVPGIHDASAHRRALRKALRSRSLGSEAVGPNCHSSRSLQDGLRRTAREAALEVIGLQCCAAGSLRRSNWVVLSHCSPARRRRRRVTGEAGGGTCRHPSRRGRAAHERGGLLSHAPDELPTDPGGSAECACPMEDSPSFHSLHWGKKTPPTLSVTVSPPFPPLQRH